MNWNRGGQQQRAKVQEQYVMMGPNPGLTIMMKNGFVIGKGLGDGKGRLGAPWGLQGRRVRSGTTTTLRTYMVPTMVPLFPAIPGAPIPPMVPILVPMEVEQEEPRWRWKEFRCYKLWGCPYPVEPASRCSGAAKGCQKDEGIECGCCDCYKVPGGAARLYYFPHRYNITINSTITIIIGISVSIVIITTIAIIITITHRCAKDSFGLGWDEEMDEEFRQRGHITLDMFLKAKEAPKSDVESTLAKVVADIKEIKLGEPGKYEVPQVPSKSKFTYNTDFINRERNPANKGVKAFYNNNNFMVMQKDISAYPPPPESFNKKPKDWKNAMTMAEMALTNTE